MSKSGNGHKNPWEDVICVLSANCLDVSCINRLSLLQGWKNKFLQKCLGFQVLIYEDLTQNYYPEIHIKHIERSQLELACFYYDTTDSPITYNHRPSSNTVQQNLLPFSPRCIECRHGPAIRILSVCLSNACIVTGRKKDLSRFLYHTKDHFA